MLRESGRSFGNLCTFLSFLLGFQIDSPFLFPPSRSETRATFLKKEKKTQTNHFRLQIQPVSPPAALLSSQVSCTPGCVRAFLCPRRAKPRICLHARNYAPLGSAVTARTKRRNADEGRTAGLSCDSNLLQDLCRAPLPPLCQITLEIPFNSPSLPLSLWDRGASLPPSNGRSANRRPPTPPPSPLPPPRSATSNLKCQNVKYTGRKWRAGAFEILSARIYEVWRD